jgi:hypothetical protein
MPGQSTPQDVIVRLIAAAACLATALNPDGTQRGS